VQLSCSGTPGPHTHNIHSTTASSHAPDVLNRLKTHEPSNVVSYAIMVPHSRNSISLNIAGRSDEHYDQICALSQKVINENFEILFKQREEEFSSIKYWDDQNNAKLVCDLAPPTLQLMMGASEEPEYYFELRYELEPSNLPNDKELNHGTASKREALGSRMAAPRTLLALSSPFELCLPCKTSLPAASLMQTPPQRLLLTSQR
jgi:hypothetical protein